MITETLLKIPFSVQHFRLKGEITSAQERCLSQIWYGLATSLAYPSGEEGVISSFKQFLLAVRKGRGGGVGTLWN